MEESKSVQPDPPFLTRFERARVIGERAQQLSMNAPPRVDHEGFTCALKIAEKELLEGKLPMSVKRFFPDGSFQMWDVNVLHSKQQR
jgi:DNA-directed RNA polymerase I, II, and III subunit RPABC2